MNTRKILNPAAITVFLFSLFLISACSSEHDEASEEAIDEITAPVGQVNVDDGSNDSGSSDAASTASSGGKGQEIYDAVCFACHAQGLAGAPKQGDTEAWAARIAQGNDTLYANAINGYTGASGSMMPAKGGRADLSDDDIKAAVDYMTSASGGSVAAPAEEVAPAAVETEAAPMEAASTGGSDGKAIYEATCSICHNNGVAGAPKYGVAEDWTTRIAQGNDTLYDHAINGFMSKGLMPPKGGKMDLSDDDVKAAVDYMVAGSQ